MDTIYDFKFAPESSAQFLYWNEAQEKTQSIVVKIMDITFQNNEKFYVVRVNKKHAHGIIDQVIDIRTTQYPDVSDAFCCFLAEPDELEPVNTAFELI